MVSLEGMFLVASTLYGGPQLSTDSYLYCETR